ncbi:hypothetical protein LB542_28405, partial [Mesorhizobium sp. BR1-1-9]|nr:hypothetical protein [Mesorhizobium sp. BR1-1-9]
MVRSPRVLAVGGAHIDRRGQVSGAYVPAASNPGTMREDVGGGVFNALRSTVRRGVSGSLLSVRGFLNTLLLGLLSIGIGIPIG